MSIFFSDDPDSDEEPPPPQRRRVWPRRALAVLGVTLVVILAAGALYVGSVSRSFTSNVSRSQLLPPPAPTGDGLPGSPSSPRSSDPSDKPKAAGDPINYVLMGSDSQEAGDASAGRSDSLMILHLAGDRQSAHLISFPRDMYVDIPGHGKNKINAAFSFGGPPLAVQTLQQLVGINIDHAALIDFQGFIDLTTELGGVTVNNKYASRSGPYVYPKGPIHIEGEEALLYVRERKNLPNGDLDRAERQRAVTQAVIAKGLSRETLANPAKLNAFVTTMAKHLTVDEGLSNGEILRTAQSLRLSPADVSSLQAPISGFATIGGQSVDLVDEAGLKRLSDALKQDTMAEYEKSLPAR